MSKLNTFSAALLAASMLVMPSSAGQPGQVLKGGPVYTPSTPSTAGSVVHTYPGYNAAHGTGASYSGTVTCPLQTMSSGRYVVTSSAASGCASTAYTGTTAYAQAPVTSSYASAGSYTGPRYSSSTSYTATGGGTRYVDTMTINGPTNVYADNIVCLLHGREVPCASIPGLADALRAQGMHTIADQLPQVPASAYYDPAYINARLGQGQYGYTQGGYAMTTAQAGYTQAYTTTGAGYVSAPVATGYTTGYASGPVNSGYGPYGTYYYGSQGTTYGAQTVTSGTPILTPCGEFIGMTCGSLAPVTVRLDNGTMYAFGGGVGAGVYGEFYGGGGTLIEGGASYSGVLNAAASQFTFNRRTPRPDTRIPNRPHHGGGHNGHGGYTGGGHGGGHWSGPRNPHPTPRVPQTGSHGGHNGGSCGSSCGSANYGGRGRH